MPLPRKTSVKTLAKRGAPSNASYKRPAPARARKSAPVSVTQPPAESDAATRDRILLEAARLFRHQGYAATTLRDVAGATGIKAGSIYYHFASKEHILVEVLDKGIELVSATVRQRVDALAQEATARERIGAAIEGHLWGLLQHGDFTSANIRVYGQIPAAAKDRHKRVRRRYADYWDALLQDAIKRGELRERSSLGVTRLFIIGALNWTVEWFDPAKGSFQDFARQIKSIVFDGVLQPDNRSPSRPAGAG